MKVGCAADGTREWVGLGLCLRAAMAGNCVG
jgi:hypothetical protein